MRTLEYRGNATIGIGEKPIPEPNKDQVRIRIAYAGICGTDMHISDGQHPRAKAGLTMGHEFSGIIDKAGSDTTFTPGEHVIVEPLISCGTCYSCRAGFPHVCANLGLYGIDQDGGFADYCVVPAQSVYRLPDSIPLVHGALVEPLAVGVHAVRLSRTKVMDTVLVIGGGPIGFFVATAARQAGAEVYIAEINPFRRRIIEEMGFSLFDLPSDGDMTRRDEVTDGKGFDVVFDAAGGEPTLRSAVDLARVRGEVVIVAVPPQDRVISYTPIAFKEISFVGVRVYEYYDFKRAIQLLEGLTIELSKLYRVFPLRQYQEAFEAAKQGDGVMRVLFSLGEGAAV